MNKRIAKKIKALSTHTETVRDFTLQEAWDKVAHHLANDSNPSYFIHRKDYEWDGYYGLHTASGKYLLVSSKRESEMKETEWPEWEHKIEPEEVTFWCSQCNGNMDAQQDLDNDGICTPCVNAQNEMWAKELEDANLEYRNMKI